MMSTQWTVAVPSGASLSVELAQAADAERIVAISEDAAARVRALGFDPGQPPRPLSAIVADRIGQGVLYVARLAGEGVATVTLSWQLEQLWRDLPLDALYIHGLMVRRASAGQGIGTALLRWAEEVASAVGKIATRLDCMASNQFLRAYYTRAGYTYRGDASAGTYTGSRFEKLLTSRPTEGDASRDA